MRTVEEVYEGILNRIPAIQAQAIRENPSGAWSLVIRAIAAEIVEATKPVILDMRDLREEKAAFYEAVKKIGSNPVVNIPERMK